jgi:NADPH2:quinone reductase
VKVEASTINPSDKMYLQGNHVRKPLPATPGLEGVGRVVEAKGADLQKYIGKRVCFGTSVGSWAEYSTTSMFFEIDDDVPVSSAASGMVNPLTVLGFVHIVKAKKFTGIIHTAAASALGRQLIKICKTENIPLLNIVRRKEQAELLKSEGAEHIIVTDGDWQPAYKEIVQKLKVNVLFDALGGGDITQKLIEGLLQPSSVYIYGTLARQPLLTSPAGFFTGLVIRGFYMTSWINSITPEEKKHLAENYSKYLKGDLSTKTFKECHLKDIKEAIVLSDKHATEGKILLRP